MKIREELKLVKKKAKKKPCYNEKLKLLNFISIQKKINKNLFFLFKLFLQLKWGKNIKYMMWKSGLNNFHTKKKNGLIN